jgi:chromosome segregation ATPase
MSSKLVFALFFLGLFSLNSASIVTRYTAWNAADGGSIEYLDRHANNCGAGEALSTWRLERSGDRIRFKITCIKSDSIKPHGVGNYRTPYNDTNWWSKKCINYLDRHNVACSTHKSNTAMQSWRLGRSGRKINVGFSCVTVDTICCKHVKTAKNSSGKGESFYLDRHLVGGVSYKGEWAMKNWKMYTNKKQMWFSSYMCKIRDIDATENLANMKSAYNQTNEDVRMAKDEKTNLDREIAQNDATYQSAKSDLATAKQTVVNLADILKTSEQLVQEAQQKLVAAQEAHAKSTQEAQQSAEFLNTHTQKVQDHLATTNKQRQAVKSTAEAVDAAHANRLKVHGELLNTKDAYTEALSVISDLENKLAIQETLKFEYENKVEDDKQAVIAHKDEIEEVKLNITAEEADITETQADIVDRKKDVTTMVNALETAHAVVEDLRKQLEVAELAVTASSNHVTQANEFQAHAESNLVEHQQNLQGFQADQSAEEELLQSAESKLSEDQSTLEGVVGSIINIEEEIKDAEEVKSAKSDDVRSHNDALTEAQLLVLQAENNHEAASDLKSATVQRLRSAQNLKATLQGALEEDVSEKEEDAGDVDAAKLALKQAERYHNNTQTRYNRTKASFDIFESEMTAQDADLLIKFRQQRGLKDTIDSLTAKFVEDKNRLTLAQNDNRNQCN